MLAQAEMYNLKIGQKAPFFQLNGVDGKEYLSENFFEKKFLVIVFMCNHCPYVLAYIERIKALAKAFTTKNVQFIGINANDSIKYPQDSFENMKIFAVEKNLSFLYLYDKTQEVARAYGALLTPHVMVFDKEQKLVYNGGIDDNWKYPEKATKHYLKDALIALTEGKTPEEQLTPCIGCSVKWR